MREREEWPDRRAIERKTRCGLYTLSVGKAEGEGSKILLRYSRKLSWPRQSMFSLPFYLGTVLSVPRRLLTSMVLE